MFKKSFPQVAHSTLGGVCIKFNRLNLCAVFGQQMGVDMLFHIIKKDFLLIKKYILFMFIVSVGIPIFVYMRIGERLGALSSVIAFLMQLIFTQFLMNNSLSLVETKYEKAQALLCVTPYTRGLLVKGKYAFNLILFAYCLVVFIIVTLFFPEIIKDVSIVTISFIFLFMTILIGLKIPLEFKFGYEKIKYIFLGAMIVTPYILPTVFKFISKNNNAINNIRSTPPIIQAVIISIFALILFLISFIISQKIYDKKEL